MYLVIENTPGYMPESNPEVFTNLRDAHQFAAWLAKELREMGYTVRGSAKSGYYYAELSPDVPGRVIEIVRVRE